MTGTGPPRKPDGGGQWPKVHRKGPETAPATRGCPSLAVPGRWPCCPHRRLSALPAPHKRFPQRAAAGTPSPSGAEPRVQEQRLHAEADLRWQRIGHARPPVAVAERLAAVRRRAGLRRPAGHRPLLHRRHPQAPAVAAGLHQPDGEPVPPPGPGASRRRSAWCNRSATAVRGSRIPITGSKAKAKRVEFRAPVLQPTPGVPGDAAREPERHHHQTRTARHHRLDQPSRRTPHRTGGTSAEEALGKVSPHRWEPRPEAGPEEEPGTGVCCNGGRTSAAARTR